MDIWPGQPLPLGARYDGAGTNFSLFSEVAEQVELCLFDDDGIEHRLALPEVTAHCWHGYAPSVAPGQRYGYRVRGPWAPREGLRCNPAKLLLDPYARAVHGAVTWGPAVFDHVQGEPDGAPDGTDSAASMPRSLVVSPYFDWANDHPPRTPWEDTVIYELHVKGFTARHPDVPPELRGTYGGLAHPTVVEHFLDLGVTAIELLPVHHHVPEQALVERGLTNYWGYNSIGYFAPHGAYASVASPGGQVEEFKHMVKSMHAAGIEVILDVVYNHTAEGGYAGPTLCFRGIDNAAYYRLSPDDRRHYVDYTGCGNSLNMRHPHVLQLIMDSLRYWVLEMHVDGFRFDLASALARELHAVDRLSAFLDLIHQDPVVNRVKLIAEPWDVGEGGYQVGNFPGVWSEWNGRFRDTVRDFWRGREQTLGELALRLTGSSDLYASTGRRPYASINFVTSHDGFTLRDLVSHDRKHNEANGEANRDGENDNRSWNCGAEGDTDDPDVLELRARQQRNLLTTLVLSQGVPMLTAGDELGRTQRGNNNAYCQDNELSWIDWERRDDALLAFARALLRLRHEHPVFHRHRWFEGHSIRGRALRDIGWFRPDGEEMRDQDWQVAFARSLGVFLNGRGIEGRDARGRKVLDTGFYLILNAGADDLRFTLPTACGIDFWHPVIDTNVSAPPNVSGALAAGSDVHIQSRSMRVFREIVPGIHR